MSDEDKAQVTISVPEVSGEEAAEAMDLAEHLLDNYQITAVDANALYNALVAVFIRSRLVYGDRQPSICSFADLLNTELETKKN